MAEELPARSASAVVNPAELSAQYQELLREADLEPLGFSARLNLLLDLAAQIFARLTESYAIAHSSYDANAVFQRCLQLIQQFNIYDWQDFQPGHMEPFRSLLFPADEF